MEVAHGIASVSPLVKVCGVTNVRDAVVAAQAGASYVGMILWPKSKRSISIDTAKSISYAVRAHNAQPVGVFVDEDAETIQRQCVLSNIDIAQVYKEDRKGFPILSVCVCVCVCVCVSSCMRYESKRLLPTSLDNCMVGFILTSLKHYSRAQCYNDISSCSEFVFSEKLIQLTDKIGNRNIEDTMLIDLP
jgi:hypothetical protein